MSHLPLLPRLIVALDCANKTQAREFVQHIDPLSCRLKVGKELFTCAGPSLVEELQTLSFDVFLDLKFHDIPNTVKGACRAAANLGVWMLTVHASGGREMLLAAREGIDMVKSRAPLLMGVTVLTSSNQTTLNELGIAEALDEHVLRLAKLAKDSHLEGVICSGQELTQLSCTIAQPFLFTVPGIRLEASDDDQKRCMQPYDAIRAGASYLVVGRPITQAKNPQSVIERIKIDIAKAAMA